MAETLAFDTLVAFQHGDPLGFNKVFSHFYKDIYYFAEKITANRPEAEDIALDSFRKLFVRYAVFNTEPNIRAFLYITTRNACFNYLRYQQRQTSRQKEFITYLEDDNNLENEQIHIETLKTIYAAVEKLPEECQKIFKMIYVGGLKSAEIADQLQISEATVRSQKRRALQLLKKELNQRQYLMLLVSAGSLYSNLKDLLPV